MTRILVTGGAGFIGSHMVDRLMRDNNEVTVFDNLSQGRKEFIEHHLGKGNFRFIQADLKDLDEVKAAMRGQDTVFHFGTNGDIRRGLEETDLHLKEGTIATYNVLEAMRINKTKKIVFSSSATIYGEPPITPLPEDYGPLLPISLYGAGKLASEGLVSAFCYTYDMQGWIFRLATIVGKRMGHGVLYDFIGKLRRNPHELEILGSGRQSRPFVHVEDCIEAILFGLGNSDDDINIFNIGCSTSTDITTIANMVVRAMGLRDTKFRYTSGDRGWPGDVLHLRFNIEKLGELGWRAKYNSDEAAQKAIRDLLLDRVK